MLHASNSSYFNRIITDYELLGGEIGMTKDLTNNSPQQELKDELLEFLTLLIEEQIRLKALKNSNTQTKLVA